MDVHAEAAKGYRQRGALAVDPWATARSTVKSGMFLGCCSRQEEKFNITQQRLEGPQDDLQCTHGDESGCQRRGLQANTVADGCDCS